MVATETSLLVIAVVQSLGCIVLVVALLYILPRITSLLATVQETLLVVRKTLNRVEGLARDLRDRRVIEKLLITLDSATGAVGSVEPLADDLKATMANARDLLDDATQTSQSVRQRIDDLAATQTELNSLVKSLTDVSCELRDHELARKLTNVLSDTSLLAADIGMLTENANSYLESGKPLVSNISNVVSNAKERAGGITGAISSLKDGISSGKQALNRNDKGGK